MSDKNSSSNSNLTFDFTVEQTPEEAFAAINDVRGWWEGEIDGPTDKLGDEFIYRYKDMHRSVQRVTESVPGQRIVWHVVDANLTFIADGREWVGTDIVFDIAPTDSGTEVRFTHVGIIPAVECFDMVADAWGTYVKGALRSLITAGNGLRNESAGASVGH